MSWRILVGGAVVAAMAGCGPQGKPIRGTWLFEGDMRPVLMTFNADGTYIVDSDVSTMKVRQEGTFQQPGKWLYLQPTKVTASDARLQSSYDKGHLPPFRAMAHWESDDTIRLTAPGQSRSAMLRRKK